jgi:hypothetical protein
LLSDTDARYLDKPCKASNLRVEVTAELRARLYRCYGKANGLTLRVRGSSSNREVALICADVVEVKRTGQDLTD